MIIAAILKQKGHQVVSVPPATSIAELCRTLSDKRIGACPVMRGEEVLGMISERDVVRAISRQGARALELSAADLMTQMVHTCSPANTIADVMEIMTAGRIRHLPVVKDGRMLGIVSIGDVVKARIDETEHEVDSLKAYVAGAA